MFARFSLISVSLGAVIMSVGNLFQSLSEGLYSDVQSESPLMQLYAISLCPIATHQREDAQYFVCLMHTRF